MLSRRELNSTNFYGNLLNQSYFYSPRADSEHKSAHAKIKFLLKLSVGD